MRASDYPTPTSSQTDQVSIGLFSWKEGQTSTDDTYAPGDVSLVLRRPCECGCDFRNDFEEYGKSVGYLFVCKDGVGFNVKIYEEAIYEHIRGVIGGER